MRELDFSIFTQHNGLQACAAIMEVIAVQVRTTGCPELTYADAIQVVGAAAVAASGGPMCDMLMGRPDAAVADDTSVLPSQCHDVTILIDGFTRNGFTDPATSLVVLSGAHNIGRSQVTGQSRCSRGLGPLTAAPNSFDGHYYNEVVDNTGRRGWFSSDQTLADNGAPTVSLGCHSSWACFLLLLSLPLCCSWLHPIYLYGCSSIHNPLWSWCWHASLLQLLHRYAKLAFTPPPL